MAKKSKPIKNLGGNQLEQWVDRVERLVYEWRAKAKQLEDSYSKRQK